MVLIFSLFQGFWHEQQELLLFRVGNGETGISEVTYGGETLGNPPSACCFANFFAGNRQQLNPVAEQRSEKLQQPSVAWLGSSPGQNRRINESIHLEEWGLTVLHLPRSDG